jgi:hypothetical protein
MRRSLSLGRVLPWTPFETTTEYYNALQCSVKGHLSVEYILSSCLSLWFFKLYDSYNNKNRIEQC